MQRPPWARTIASTIARPSPTPPCAAGARRVGAREAVEDPLERIRRDAATLVLDLDHERRRRRRGSAQLDRVARLGVLHGVLEQRVERDPQRLRVGAQRARRSRPPSRHARGDDLGPAHEDVLEERLDVDLGSGRRSPAAPPWPAAAAARGCARSARARRARRRSPARSSRSRAAAPRGGRARSSPASAARATTSWRKRSWRSSSSRAARRASSCRSRTASCRRRACQTIARNIADISGTSNSSPHSCSPCERRRSDQPAGRGDHAARARCRVAPRRQTRKP